MQNEFKAYHPIVNLVYFVFVIGFSVFFMHPVCLAISLLCSLVYVAMLKGKNFIKKSIIYGIPLFVLTAVINPLFNHGGVTILAYMPSGNPLTFESIIFGVAAAAMLAGVICYFACFNEIITSDKIIYLFGRFVPSISLVISMTLSFVPRFADQLRRTRDAQRCIGLRGSDGSVVKKIKHGLSLMSIMVTWALENAADTADSMKSRGYGLGGRTSYSIYRFDRRDACALACILGLGLYTLAGGMVGAMSVTYFPAIVLPHAGAYSLSVFGAYFALCITPVIIEIWEMRKWKYIEQKM